VRGAAPRILALAVVGLVVVAARPVQAHEVRPGYLQVRQTGAETYDVLWKVPARNGGRLRIEARLPEAWEVVVPPARYTLATSFVDRWTIRAPDGLAGTIRIEGLEATRTDVLARIEWSSGRSQAALLTPQGASFEVEVAASWPQTARTYAALGVEHILLGIDHLLFVLALLLLVRDARTLVKTVTSFTVAHSITLALSALGLFSLPGAPVEAVIALSIVFMAREVVTLQRGGSTLTSRRPWLVAFAFGLFHGLGFAGALAELGLPHEAVSLALASFNVGVELGQLLFVAAVLAAVALARRVPWTPPPWTQALPAYGIGCVATCWFLERALPLLG
jgi:hydrogenase/urease accessory protein HupE